VPAAPAFAGGLERVAGMVAKAEGQLMRCSARAQSAIDESMMQAEFSSARTAEWIEFTSECGKFADEIAKELRIGKLTVAELGEEEHNLDRLRRWARELQARDIFKVAEGVDCR
jgi:hypothetical protein